MGTRSNIIVGNQQFYHHWDGYPEGVGADLAYFLANINAGYLPAWNKSIEKLAEYLRYNGIPIIGYPALSRRDGKTEICSACGEREAWEDCARAGRFRR